MDYKGLDAKKKKLDKHQPLSKEFIHNLNQWFRIELTYTSNAIEGNTLTRQETALVVEKKITVGGKSLIEHLEATNHADAFDWILLQIHRSPHQITENDILKIHEVILKNIQNEYAGRYRNVPVRISGSLAVMPNPRKVPDLMFLFIKWLKTSKNMHPVELASLAHYKLVSIHPFIDGNGRTARLLMNMILMMKGYPPAIIRKRDRLNYINALEKAQTGGTIDSYMTMIISSVDRSLDIYLNTLQGKKNISKPKHRLLKIGELSKLAHENNSTIRHWTKEGLLDVAEFTESGYQLYDKNMLDQIKKIKDLKEKRLTLSEIKKILLKII